MRNRHGLLTFEYDTITKDVKEAEWKPGSTFCSYSATEGSTKVEIFLLVQRPDCQYFKALNLKNAKRKAANLK